MIQEHRYVVVGAGPAGLQIGYFLQERGADYLVVERKHSAGDFFSRFPRHRRLNSLNKVHTLSDDPEIRLRWDWNSLLSDDPSLLFPQYSDDYLPSPDDLRRYLHDFHTTHDLRIAFGVGVDRVAKEEDGFRLETAAGPELRAECLIWAGGWGAPNIPDIPGIEYAEGYEDMSVDPEQFRGKRVLILGKGNSAFETAHELIGHASMIHLASPRPVRPAWNTRHPGDVHGMYGALFDGYRFKTLHAVLDCTVDRIAFDGETYAVDLTYSHADGETATLEYDAVLRCTGFRMHTEMFADGLKMAPCGKLPEIRADWESANLDNLYFAGTLMQARDLKRASSAFIEGFRYNLRTMDRLLAERYDGIRLPHTAVPLDELTGSILDRLNRSSALWTQCQYLIDALVVTDGGVERYEELPEDYAVERFGDVITVGLRRGENTYPVERHPVPSRAAESAFIHPVIRVFRGGVLTEELHLLEDLLAEWRHPDRHVAPLEEFLRRLSPR
ncbi:NAD(P)-binding domain-containing protein [Streptosporangium subroseum]|uniref:NAD(P)-binding domain-containing protein n=1 Tax=Streptosporangium subroseum TaxID=106412 RepID=UPI0034157560